MFKNAQSPERMSVSSCLRFSIKSIVSVTDVVMDWRLLDVKLKAILPMQKKNFTRSVFL